MAYTRAERALWVFSIIQLVLFAAWSVVKIMPYLYTYDAKGLVLLAVVAVAFAVIAWFGTKTASGSFSAERFFKTMCVDVAIVLPLYITYTVFFVGFRLWGPSPAFVDYIGAFFWNPPVSLWVFAEVAVTVAAHAVNRERSTETCNVTTTERQGE